MWQERQRFTAVSANGRRYTVILEEEHVPASMSFAVESDPTKTEVTGKVRYRTTTGSPVHEVEGDEFEVETLAGRIRVKRVDDNGESRS